jgi:hypothetical protein
MKIFLLPADANTGTFNLIEPTSDKKMNIAPANGELAPVKASDRAVPTTAMRKGAASI